MQLKIWTVGHSTHSEGQFLGLLQGHHIEAIADVRRFPGSKRYPQFGADRLSSSLRARGVDYVHFPELGGRRTPIEGSQNLAWRNQAFRGYADYMDSIDFQAGMKRLQALAMEKRTAILCAEAVWWRCHRALISDLLKSRGACVLHILTAKKADEHPYTSAASIVNGRLSYEVPKEGELFK